MAIAAKKLRIALKILLVLFPMLQLGISGCSLLPGSKQPSSTPTETHAPTFTTASLPDLVIGDVTIEIDIKNPCATDKDGKLIRVQVKNQGEADAKPFIVEMHDTWRLIEDGLAIGAETIVWFQGDDTATIKVDAAEQISERDERNNQITREFEIPSPPPHCFQTPTPTAAIIKPLHTLEGHTGPVLSVSFSPDGNLVASGSVDNTLRLWRVNEAALLRTMRGHPFPVLTLQFSPDGAILATGSTDGLGRLWRVSNGKLTGYLNGHAGWVTSLDISNDGKLIVSCAEDYTVRIWRIVDGKLVQTIDEGMAAINDVKFSPDNESIAWAEANGNVRLRTLAGSWLHFLKDTDEAATSIAFSPDGRSLAVGYADGAIRILDVVNGDLMGVVQGHGDAVSSLTFSPDGQWMVSGSLDSTIRLWSLEDQGATIIPLFILGGHTGSVNSVAFSPKGALIASGSSDSTVRLWEIPEEE